MDMAKDQCRILKGELLMWMFVHIWQLIAHGNIPMAFIGTLQFMVASGQVCTLNLSIKLYGPQGLTLLPFDVRQRQAAIPLTLPPSLHHETSLSSFLPLPPPPPTPPTNKDSVGELHDKHHASVSCAVLYCTVNITVTITEEIGNLDGLGVKAKQES